MPTTGHADGPPATSAQAGAPDSTQEKAKEAASDVKDKAQEVASQAQYKAREAGGQARSRVRDQVDQRSTQAGEQVKSNARDVRSVADELRKQGKDTPARYAEQAADRAERLGGYLENIEGDQILHDVEDFGRRNPWAIAAGGLLLGFVASRMLKASSTQRYQSSQAGLVNGGPRQGGSVSHSPQRARLTSESYNRSGVGDARAARFESQR